LNKYKKSKRYQTTFTITKIHTFDLSDVKHPPFVCDTLKWFKSLGAFMMTSSISLSSPATLLEGMNPSQAEAVAY
jgi:hypothetical protein